MASCTTVEECCSLCSSDSIRCARGPCSQSILVKTFFSSSMPIENFNFWDFLFSAYSMTTYLYPLCVLIAFITYKGKLSLILMFFFIPLWAMINMLLVKSFGHCSECPRPCGSCVSTQGMPSGHSVSSIGLSMWILLELYFGYALKWPIKTKIAWSILYLAIFLPVPYSRVYLGDHSELQVVIGSALGIVFAIIYFLFLQLIISKRLRHRQELQIVCIRFENDYVESRWKSESPFTSIEEIDNQEIY